MSYFDSDEDIPQLSQEALAALKEFYSQQIGKPDEVLDNSEIKSTHPEFQENWQLSQFWYDNRTARVLAKEAFRICGGNGKAALISCPTLYRWIKEESCDCQVYKFYLEPRNWQMKDSEALQLEFISTLVLQASCEHWAMKVTLFEFDDRFASYGSDFIRYDYNLPLDVPPELANSFDIVIADPPFLSEECLTKTLETVKLLARDKIVLCTGAVMQDLAKKLLNLERTKFEPQHKNNLANQFCCYSNYDMDRHLILE